VLVTPRIVGMCLIEQGTKGMASTADSGETET
jgi:hypothetical protein